MSASDVLWTLIGNLAIILPALAAILGARAFARRPYFRRAMEAMMRPRRARISWYVILFYLGLGLCESITIPVELESRVVSGGEEQTIVLRNPSLIDWLFSGVPRERTYSAPFASRVTGLPESENNSENLAVRGTHLLGTDVNGNDVLVKTMKGARTALLLSLGVIVVSFPIGILLGMLAGYLGGWVDDLIQWIYTTTASIPWLLFVIAFLMVFGRGLFWICLALGLTNWVELARLVRGETLRLKQLDYITAARSLGATAPGILWRHILPNVTHLVVILVTLMASQVILAESILTFIGIGVEPGTASWGAMLIEAQNELMRSPIIWWIFAAGSFLGIFPLVLCLNIFGDALRDALDPRLRDES